MLFINFIILCFTLLLLLLYYSTTNSLVISGSSSSLLNLLIPSTCCIGKIQHTMLQNEDFNDDKVDAGELGAGHTVTALYEITPSGSSTAALDPLRYGTQDDDRSEALNPNEYGFLKIRYKLPDEDKSKLISRPLTVEDEVASVGAASQDMRFAASVAGFGELLKGGRYTKAYTYDQIIALAQAAKGEDRFGYRSEFINLVRLADSIERLQ